MYTRRRVYGLEGVGMEGLDLRRRAVTAVLGAGWTLGGFSNLNGVRARILGLYGDFSPSSDAANSGSRFMM